MVAADGLGVLRSARSFGRSVEVEQIVSNLFALHALASCIRTKTSNLARR